MVKIYFFYRKFDRDIIYQKYKLVLDLRINEALNNSM